MAYKRNLEIFEEAYEKKDAKSVVSYVARDGRKRYIAGSKSPDGGGTPMPSGGMEEVKWQELKDKRDNGELNPGSLYRITDYNCTTTQENTQSANHQFDIVLLALSKDKLAEEGWAMMHDNIYDVTFTGDNVTKKCYLYKVDEDDELIYYNIVDVETKIGQSYASDLVIDEVNKTAETGSAFADLTEENLPYNYFQNSNLSAWKVWYCLDNDTYRFAWADDSLDESTEESINIKITQTKNDIAVRVSSQDVLGTAHPYAWSYNNGTKLCFTTNAIPNVDDHAYTSTDARATTLGTIVSYTPAHEGTGLPNGRGVIYRLIDEWGNDVGYDFKNIQFLRPMTDGQYDAQGTDTWAYTFNLWYNDSCVDGSIIGNTLLNDEDIVEGVKDNLITETPINWIVDSTLASDKKPCCGLSNNVVLAILEGDWFYGIANINIKGGSSNNTISVGEALAAHINILERSEGNIVERSLVSLIDCIQSTISSESVYCIKALELTVSSPGFYFNEKKVLTEE